MKSAIMLCVLASTISFFDIAEAIKPWRAVQSEMGNINSTVTGIFDGIWYFDQQKVETIKQNHMWRRMNFLMETEELIAIAIANVTDWLKPRSTKHPNADYCIKKVENAMKQHADTINLTACSVNELAVLAEVKNFSADIVRLGDSILKDIGTIDVNCALPTWQECLNCTLPKLEKPRQSVRKIEQDFEVYKQNSSFPDYTQDSDCLRVMLSDFKQVIPTIVLDIFKCVTNNISINQTTPSDPTLIPDNPTNSNHSIVTSDSQTNSKDSSVTSDNQTNSNDSIVTSNNKNNSNNPKITSNDSLSEE